MSTPIIANAVNTEFKIIAARLRTLANQLEIDQCSIEDLKTSIPATSLEFLKIETQFRRLYVIAAFLGMVDKPTKPTDPTNPTNPKTPTETPTETPDAKIKVVFADITDIPGGIPTITGNPNADSEECRACEDYNKCYPDAKRSPESLN